MLRSHALACVALAVTTVGCKEDPPPPPVPVAAPLASASTSASAGSAQVPRISPDTMRRYRVETCLFGVQGLYVLRDAYLASVGESGPSADKLPSFGEYPDQRRLLGRGKKDAKKEPPPAGSAAASGAPAASGSAAPAGSAKRLPPGGMDNPRLARRNALAAVRQVPFLRYLRSCQIAKRPDPADSALDPALKAFDEYVAPLNALLLEATRYYSAKRYETDDFKRGKAIHERLQEELPKLDEKLGALVAAANAYEKTRPAEVAEPVGPAGKAGRAAVSKARAATMLVLADTIDAEALGTAIGELETAVEALDDAGETDRMAPHPKLLAQPLGQLVEALKAVKDAEGEPTLAQRYAVTSAMTAVLENEQRALSQVLRRKKGGRGRFNRGGRRLDPNLGIRGAPLRPRLRGVGSGHPTRRHPPK